MSLLLFSVQTSAPAPVPARVVTAFDALLERVDRAAFSTLGGGAVLYQPKGGSAVPVTGMFDAQYVLAKGDAEAGAETLGPALFVRLSDLPTDPENDDPRITIASSVYRVIERRPDGHGGIVLVLRLVT